MNTKRTSTLITAGFLLGLGACGKERPKAAVTKSPAPANAQEQGAAAPEAVAQVAKAKQVEPPRSDKAPAKPVKVEPGSWTLQSGQSFVGIEVLKGTGEHYARFKEVSGQATAGAKGFEGIAVQVKTESFEADVPAFAEHVRSEHFLNVKRYPQASFVSTSLRKDPGPEANRYMLEGDLTLREVKERVTMQADIVVKGDQMELQGRVPLNFKAYGMSASKIANELIDGVELSLRLHFVKPAAAKR